MLKEWPLVAFTILGQTAVGVFGFFHLPFLARVRTPLYDWRVTWLVVLALVFLLSALAAIVSFFHLRHPFRARFVLSNLRASWLSREILFEIVFMALVALSGWLASTRTPSRGLLWALLVAACLAGGLFLVSMTKLYMLPTLPAWRDVHTPLSFFLTTLVLGALATEIVVRVVAGPGVFELDLTRISSVLVLVEIILAVFIAPRHGVLGTRPGPSLRPSGDPPRLLHWARIACLAAGLFFIGMEIGSAANNIMNERGAGATLLLAFAFVLTGEVAGRFQFYGLVGRSGD
jgi:anaerobic dimethyl sulfoxide reductase subunit C (anchor subunit)